MDHPCDFLREGYLSPVHARRSLISNAAHRCATAFRSAAVVTVSFPRCSSSNAALSSMASASNRFSRVFSSLQRLLSSLGLRDLHPADLRIPFVNAGVADAAFPARRARSTQAPPLAGC